MHLLKPYSIPALHVCAPLVCIMLIFFSEVYSVSVGTDLSLTPPLMGQPRRGTLSASEETEEAMSAEDIHLFGDRILFKTRLRSGGSLLSPSPRVPWLPWLFDPVVLIGPLSSCHVCKGVNGYRDLRDRVYRPHARRRFGILASSSCPAKCGDAQ